MANFRLPRLATATETWKNFKAYILVYKFDVPIGYFMVPLQMLTSEVWNIISNSLTSIYVSG